MRKLWPIFLLVVLCLSIPTALAQDSAPATLTYGQVSIGQINDDSPTAAFTFEGRQADTIYISVFDSSFSVTLRLTGPTGVPMENSEDNMLVDTLIGPITLPADGTYTVTVERPEWDAGRRIRPGRSPLFHHQSHSRKHHQLHAERDECRNPAHVARRRYIPLRGVL
jgi:hypothetical protein